jgi:hypothetical protein
MVGRDRKSYQLVEGHAVFRIDVEEPGRNRREPQSLLDDRAADEEGRGNLLLALAFLPQRLKGAELVERVISATDGREPFSRPSTRHEAQRRPLTLRVAPQRHRNESQLGTGWSQCAERDAYAPRSKSFLARPSRSSRAS